MAVAPRLLLTREAAASQDHSLSQITRYLVHIHEHLSPPAARVLSASIATVSAALGVKRRRIYDIVNVLEALDVASREDPSRYRWHGTAKVRGATQHDVRSCESDDWGGAENGPLNEGQRRNFRVVHVALGTGYHRVEGNRRASRNGPHRPIRNFSIAVCHHAPCSNAPPALRRLGSLTSVGRTVAGARTVGGVPGGAARGGHRHERAGGDGAGRGRCCPGGTGECAEEPQGGAAVAARRCGGGARTLALAAPAEAGLPCAEEPRRERASAWGAGVELAPARARPAAAQASGQGQCRACARRGPAEQPREGRIARYAVSA
jgi:hypothetical protein